MTYAHIRKKHQYTTDFPILSVKRLKELWFFSSDNFTIVKPYSIDVKWQRAFYGYLTVNISEKNKEGWINTEWYIWNDEEKLYQTEVQQILLVATECNYGWLRWWFYFNDGDGMFCKYSKLFLTDGCFCSRGIANIKYRSKYRTRKRDFLDKISGEYTEDIKRLSQSIKYPYRNGYRTKKQRKLEILVRKAEFTEKQMIQADRSLNRIVNSKRFIWFCQRRGIHNPFV